MNSIILKCDNVAKSFFKNDNRLDVLRAINLEINAGEKVLIFGRSGQGKSVLLSLLCGMDSPSSGDIRFQGEWFSSYSLNKLAKLRRNDIGIIFQNLNLIPTWTALENVEAALEGIVKSANKRRHYSLELLEAIGLKDRLNHLPSEMSMGEQQRVAIARTLIRKPRLILADEPTGDLDNKSANDIIHILYSYADKTNAALLVTSHGHFPVQSFDKNYTLLGGILEDKQIETPAYD